MRKALTVAKSELSSSVRSKAFLVSLVMMPVLMIGSIVLQHTLNKRVDAKPRTCAVIDPTGQMFAGLAEKTEARNKLVAAAPGKDASGAPFTLERIDLAGKDLDQVRLELSDRIRQKQLFAFVELPADALSAEPS